MTVDSTSNAAHRAENERLAIKLKHLNAKFMAMQAAVMSIGDLGVVPVGHPLADLASIETDFQPGATVTVIAVAGMAMQIGMAPREFRASLAGRPCNFIYIKDFRQAWYQRGLMGLSASLDETAEVLKALLPPATESIRLVGSSSGAYGAIQLGLRLHADRVLAFAPQTKITPKVFKRFKTIDSDIADYDYGAPEADLRNAFADHPSFFGDIRVVYGGKNPFDIAQVTRLEGIDCVELYPLPNCPHHNVAAYARKVGVLDRLLEDLTRQDDV
ncbi:MAG: hypothetical protein AAGF60_05590 [Pseudomonadota bacterium]